MFIVEAPAALDAETAGELTLQYTPPDRHAAIVTLVVRADDVEVTGVRARLLNGTVFAVTSRAQQRANEMVTTIDLGQLEVPVRLSITLQACVPVTASETRIAMAVDDEHQTVVVPLHGSAKFLAARSRVRLSHDTVRPGEAIDVDVALINDGTALAEGAELRLRPPAWAHVTGAGSRRELTARGEALLVVAVPAIEIGATHVHRFQATVAPVVADGTLLDFAAEVVQRDMRFSLAPVAARVESRAQLRANVRLLEDRTFRHGEHVAALLTLHNTGGDVARDARLRLTSDAIAWEDAGESGALVLDFGAVPAQSKVAHVVSGVVVASPAGDATAAIELRGEVGAVVTTRGCVMRLTGAAHVTAVVEVRPMPDELAYVVRCAVSNDGDGAAAGVILRVHGCAGIVGIVDSLEVDAQPQLALDGSLAIERDGLDLGALPIRTTRAVTWKIRSAFAQDLTLAVDVAVDGAAFTVAADALAVAAGQRGSALAPAAPTVAHPSDAAVAPVVALAAPAAQNEEPEPTLAAPDDDPAAEEPTFEVGGATIARWKAWFGEDGPTSDVELGRYVLAAREFLPTRAASAEQNNVLAALRSECNAIASARLFAWKSAGTIGASGYDFGTPALRAAVERFWSLLGSPQPQLAGPTFDAALVALTAAHGTPFALEVEAFRDRLLEALDAIASTDDYACAVPDLQPAAGRLFAALCDLEVAA